MKTIYSCCLLLILSISLQAQNNYVATSPISATPGSGNVMVGINAGNTAVTGVYNTIVGHYSGNSISNGINNSFYGTSSGRYTINGSYNSFFGNDAGFLNSYGGQNTFIGMAAGYNNATASDNTYVGFKAGTQSSLGIQNTMVGSQAGNISTSSYNTYLGYRAGFTSTTGSNNTFIGYQTGYSNKSGSYNVFLGNGAGGYNTTGGSNLFMGSFSGGSNSTGSLNLFIGNSSGGQSTTGNGNTFIGDGSGFGNQTGERNTYIGQYAGYYGNNNGVNNVFIGYMTGTGTTNSAPIITNSVAIGANAIVTQNKSIVLGGTGVNSVSVGIGNTAPQNTLEITQGTDGKSGLRFTNLTSASPATAFTQTKFLTVDVNGDVIMASTNGFGGRLAAESWSVDGDRLQNTNAGSVVIGQGSLQTPAGYKLVVEEGILTEKVKVAVKNTAEWSDKVFEADYSLKPLAEVSQYIQANKHLPGVPSAREMVEKGNDLHKTDAKLLEKIEELTLYILQLQKTNQDIQQQLQAMEQKHQSEIDALKQSIKK